MTREQRLIRKVAEGTELAHFLEAHKEATILVLQYDKRKARRAVKSKPRREAEATKRAVQKEDTAALRHRAFMLSGGWCEKCEGPVTWEAGQLHHTEGGGGRVERQHIGNVAFICDPCHRFLHQQPRIAKEFRIEIREKRERTGQR